jgi:hypothetical protein
MKVSVYQQGAANTEEYGLQSNARRPAVAVDAAAQWEPDEPPSAQQALLELMRSYTDPKQYGSRSNMPEPALSELGASQAKPEGRAASQWSTLGRIQSSTGRRQDAPVSNGGGSTAQQAAAAAHDQGSGTDTYAFFSEFDRARRRGAVTETSAGKTAPATPATPATSSTGGSAKPSLNYANDQNAAERLVQSTRRSLTGMPPATISDTMAVAGLAAQLAQMDETTRERCTVRAMNLLQQPPAQRQAELAKLTGEVSREAQDIEQDPARRVASTFNAPVGTEYLQDGGRSQMHALRQQYDAFVADNADDVARKNALKNAVQIKTQMRTDIAQAMTTSDVSTQKAWDESTERVDQILAQAEKYTAKNIRPPSYTDDPQWNDQRAKAYAQTYGYQSIGEKLLSDDGLSQQERDNPGWWHGPGTKRSPDEKARDLLTFQQGMNDPNSTLYKRVHALESSAVHELTANGDTDHYLDQVGKPKLYTDIAGALPQTDGKYVQNLGQQYLDTAKDFDEKSRAMLREHVPGTLDKVLYGVGKVLDGLILPPGLSDLAGALLDVAVPNHGGLSSNEEAAIDMTTMVGGLLMGGLDKLPMLKGKFGLNEAMESKIGGLHPGETPVSPSLPPTAKERIAKILGGLQDVTLPEPPQKPESSPQGNGPVKPAEPPRHAGALGDIPRNYIQPHPDLMWNSDRYPGLMEDRKGNTYVVDGKNVYAVKRDADNATWRVYSPQDPVRPAYPIRSGQNGGWELHGDVGLKGGKPGDDGAVAGPSGLQNTGAPQGESIEQTANRWVADQNRKYASITKKYDPGQLNLKAFEHKVVSVSDEVFRTLTSAQKINEQINALMPYGAGNQHWDIQVTGGESYKRVQVRREPPAGMTEESAAAGCGAGNCDEKAELAFKLAGAKFKNSPVLLVSESGGVDHTYVLVGDPRDPAYGKSTVVVDPWPSFPTAHTTGTGPERPYLETSESSKHEPFEHKKSPLMPADQIDAAYSEIYGTPADKDSVLLEIYADDGEEKWVWTQRTSGNDVSTKYRSPSNPGGIVLDKLPDYIVERYDPYIKRNDDHNGPLFPTSGRKSDPTT